MTMLPSFLSNFSGKSVVTDARVEGQEPRSIEAWNIEGSVIGINVLPRLYFLQELQGVVDQPVHAFGLRLEVSVFERVGVM